MDELRIGVIGSGGRGGLAAHAHRPGEGSRVVACCDTNSKVFERNRERYGQDIFTTADYRELLAQPLEAVFVTTPDFHHEEHAIAALQAKRPLYLEKPMSSDGTPLAAVGIPNVQFARGGGTNSFGHQAGDELPNVAPDAFRDAGLFADLYLSRYVTNAATFPFPLTVPRQQLSARSARASPPRAPRLPR
jgi:hypothetical protein